MDQLREQVRIRVADIGLAGQLQTVQVARDRFRDTLEIFVLRGRPAGRCELCPFSGATLQ